MSIHILLRGDLVNFLKRGDLLGDRIPVCLKFVFKWYFLIHFKTLWLFLVFFFFKCSILRYCESHSYEDDIKALKYEGIADPIKNLQKHCKLKFEIINFFIASTIWTGMNTMMTVTLMMKKTLWMQINIKAMKA